MYSTSLVRSFFSCGATEVSTHLNASASCPSCGAARTGRYSVTSALPAEFAGCPKAAEKMEVSGVRANG